jgi:uncharacterized lipoprotein
MRQSNTVSRTAIAALVAVGLVSGCSWFRKDDGVYALPQEQRPLEVPPDLDRPRTDAAMQLPVTASSMSPTAPVASATAPSGFTVPGSRDEVFDKVGEALGAIDGLTIASRAQLLGAYDVNHMGQNFLVRVTAVEAGVYVAVVDPRGLPATGEGPAAVVAALKGALGG